jgi:hypothetical protein
MSAAAVQIATAQIVEQQGWQWSSGSIAPYSIFRATGSNRAPGGPYYTIKTSQTGARRGPL